MDFQLNLFLYIANCNMNKWQNISNVGTPKLFYAVNLKTVTMKIE